MQYYLPVAIAFILLSSVVLGLILYRKQLFNIRILAAIAASSIVVCALFPFVYNTVSGINALLINGVGVFLAFAITFIIYLIMVVVMSIVVSSLITSGKSKQSQEKPSAPKNREKPKIDDQDNTTKQVYISHGTSPINVNITQNITNSTSDGLINSENPVDSLRNIDKMGIGQIVNISDSLNQEIELLSDQDSLDSDIVTASLEDELADSDIFSDDLTIILAEGEKTGTIESGMQAAPAVDISMNLEEYIDEAFRLKKNGDMEGAILYFMYALDKNPDDYLAFLIVIDICSLYKDLGQVELSKDLLGNYIGDFGEYMDDARYEIERNLLSI
jgi:uncharacterized membrane protein